MALAWIAASVRADAGEFRRLSIDGLPPHEAELVALLFEILGWQVVASGGASGPPKARLSMTLTGGIIHVATDDAGLAPRLAASGLDRLVLPVSLAALEQLSVLAG